MVLQHHKAQAPGQGVRADKPLSPRVGKVPKKLRPTAAENRANYLAWLAEGEQRKARARKVSFRVH